MDQKIIANFKKLYTKALFWNCFEKCQFSPSEMTVKRFWKEEFDVVEAIRLTQKGWDQVTQRTLNSAWWDLIPAFVRGEATNDAEIIQEIVSVARELEMEVDVGE